MEMDAGSESIELAVNSQPQRADHDLESALHPQALPVAEDSAVTRAEKVERHGVQSSNDLMETPPKKRRLTTENNATASGSSDLNPKYQADDSVSTRNNRQDEEVPPTRSERQKGVAPIKAEYLVYPLGGKGDRVATVVQDDDAAEGAAHKPPKDARDQWKKGKKEKSQGMNTSRDFGSSKDDINLCASRITSPELSPEMCRFGEKCKYEHDVRKYLKDYKREDLTTFGGVCPIWDAKGKCDWGWTCRFVGSHMEEQATEDGRKELVLVQKSRADENGASGHDIPVDGIINEISAQAKNDLMKRRVPTPKADQFVSWIDVNGKELEAQSRHDAKMRRGEVDADSKSDPGSVPESSETKRNGESNSEVKESIQDSRARYTEPPLLPSEKRRIYFGPETPVLAPLTTQGNLPFRRLCASLGAQITYSEMAMSLPLIQGQRSEWALMRAHASESLPPAYSPSPSTKAIVENQGYQNSADLKFGAQIAANKPWQALKATEILTSLCPSLRVVDLNCGCPIDLVYRQGAGSALLDFIFYIEKMVSGMNVVSGSVPISVKIRMGTKDNRPSALKLVDRLVYGGADSLDAGHGPCGVAAITLHGRSRQQRYTKSADWSYIANCAALIADYNSKGDALADTIREPDPRHLANSPSSSSSASSVNPKVYFLGNGDCYSHETYHDHLSSNAGIDALMLARGALIKPWLFEEIAAGQYLDKSSSERLRLVEQYAKLGLETWGSDERGVGTTRRFLLEWLSFAYRYVPVGLLEYLPPSLQDRPPAWRGRDELETLLGSGDYRDWVKISEIFLGKAHPGFRFVPKHKSNSYEIEAEG